MRRTPRWQRATVGGCVCVLLLLFTAACIDLTPTATEEARGYLTEYTDAKARAAAEDGDPLADAKRLVTVAETALGAGTGDPEADAALGADEVYDKVEKAEVIANDGRDAMYEGQDTTAEKKLDEAIAARPQCWKYRMWRGVLALRLGEARYAKDWLATADKLAAEQKVRQSDYLTQCITEVSNVPRSQSVACNIVLYDRLADLYEKRSKAGEFLVDPNEDRARAAKYRDLAARERRK